MCRKLIISVMFSVSISVTTCIAGILPYPIQETAHNPIVFELKNANHIQGRCSLGWDQQNLMLNLWISDNTPVSLEEAGVGIEEMYRADSVEFWLNRHQFGIAKKDGIPVLYDYLYQHEIKGITGTWENSETGYTLTLKIPWKGLGVKVVDYQSFQFAVQINNRQKIKSGEN